MPEKKESREAPEKESDLKQTSLERSGKPKFTDQERAAYWREQDPKYTG